MKIALVHDDLIQHGGAERVFGAMCEMWPEADVFTSMASKMWRRGIPKPAKSSPTKALRALRRVNVFRRAGTEIPSVDNYPESDSRLRPVSDDTGFHQETNSCHSEGGARRISCGKRSFGRRRRPQDDEHQTVQLITSLMQHLPFKKQLYRYYFPFYPLAFESFDFSDYDVVLSSSARFSHGIITKPKTIHICYMNSPGRMWWEPRGYFSGFASLPTILSPLLSWLRTWDYAAAQRVDYFIANSKSVQSKIKKYYNRGSEVIYPFVDLKRFSTRCRNTGSDFCHSELHAMPYGCRGSESDGRKTLKPFDSTQARQVQGDGLPNCQTDYYLIVSRLAPWKRIDTVIEACNRLQLPLMIIGAGSDRSRLEKLAVYPKIKFAGRLSDQAVVSCYQRARALIFPQREDFGIAPLEAMASGKPVLAYGAGGALETVLEGETGEFFYSQTAEALTKKLSGFRPERYDPEACRKQAVRFSKERFEKAVRRFVNDVVNRGWAH